MKQEGGPGRRRWFESDGFDLVVWYGADDGIVGFQICYDLGDGEHALTWRPGSGFSHAVVDTGDWSPLKNQAPILHPDRDVPWSDIARRFEERSETLDARIRRLVQDKLADRAGASATPW